MLPFLPDLVRSAVALRAADRHHHVWRDARLIVSLAVINQQVGRHEHIVALQKEVQQRVVGRGHFVRLIGVVGHREPVVVRVVDVCGELQRNRRCLFNSFRIRRSFWTKSRRRFRRRRFYWCWLRRSLVDFFERHGNLAESTRISSAVYSRDPCVARDSLLQRTSVRRPLGVLGLR